MPSFSAEGGTYPDVCALIKELREAVNYDDDRIYASITSGGVSIVAAPDMVNLAKSICEKNKFSFKAGYTSHEEDVLLRSSSGFEVVEKVTNNAAAVYKEWQE